MRCARASSARRAQRFLGYGRLARWLFAASVTMLEFRLPFGFCLGSKADYLSARLASPVTSPAMM